jgi:nitrogen-specific signal transduction histidine kinase
VVEDLLAAREDFARAAATPFEARDARGRPVGVHARIELALADAQLGDQDLCRARLASVLSEIDARGSYLPCDSAAELAERVGAYLVDKGEAWAGERARAVAEHRRRVEAIHERWDDLFGRELQDAVRARRDRAGDGVAATRDLPDGGAGGGSLRPPTELARARAERPASTGWLKRRAGDRYEVLLYTVLEDARDEPIGVVAIPVDLDYFAQETVRARLAARERALPVEADEERPTFEVVERRDDEPPPDPRAAQHVGRAPLAFPLDHVEVRVKSAPPAEDAAADVSLLKQRDRIKLWLIALSVAGIAAGALVTTRTVLREVKSAELKSDFVSNVTHELKTPLTSIRMFIETLEDGRVENEEEEKECLAIMGREADRLTRLIDRLLAFSKIESRKWRFKFGYVPPLELVEDAIRLLYQQVGQTAEALPIEVDCLQRLAPLPVDKDAIVEVLLNLLSNAYKYTPGPDRRIRVVVTERRRTVEIAVEDNGIGVPRRDRRRIWKKFERGSNAEKGRFEGSGIGLTLALSIARGHGGTIWLTPLKPKGSRFTLSLPK